MSLSFFVAMEEKQFHLDEAYYGSSIPTPTRSYRRHGSDDWCDDCGSCCCLISFLLQLIGLVAVTVALVFLIFHPSKVKIHVTDASLTLFNFTTTLNYNLALNITIRNPNKMIGIYYDSIEASAFFGDRWFGSVSLRPFYQGHKNTTILSPVFEGQQLVSLGASDLSVFNSEKSAGVYDINVKLNLRIRFKLGNKIKSWRIKPEIKCDLKVPLISNGKSGAGTFEATKCHTSF